MHKIGFIGTGGVAERHAEALLEQRDVTLSGVWSRTPSNRERFAERHSTRAYAELDDLLGNADIDVVFVLSPGEAHFDHASAALKAGKHVLLEKPIGTSAKQIADLKRIAHEAGRMCMPSHNYIYAPEVRRLRHHLANGKLGRLQSFWMLCNQRQSQAMGLPGMVLHDMMIHLVYASIFFCGRPTRLCAVSSNVFFVSGADDQIGITLTFDDGTIAHLWASWATEDMSREPWSCTIKAMGATGSGVASWDNVKNSDQPQPGWDDSAYWDSFLHVQRYFLEECLGRGAAPLSTVDDALAVHKIIEAAEQSLERRAWIELDQR